jgi:hypothetical protein
MDESAFMMLKGAAWSRPTDYPGAEPSYTGVGCATLAQQPQVDDLPDLHLLTYRGHRKVVLRRLTCR